MHYRIIIDFGEKIEYTLLNDNNKTHITLSLRLTYLFPSLIKALRTILRSQNRDLSIITQFSNKFEEFLVVEISF